jgi:hypothetical protein
MSSRRGTSGYTKRRLIFWTERRRTTRPAMDYDAPIKPGAVQLRSQPPETAPTGLGDAA